MKDLTGDKRIINVVIILSFFTIFIRFIPLEKQMGMYGIGVFTGAYLVFLIYSLIFYYAYRQFLARMIKTRMKSDQYKEAEYKNAGNLARVGILVAGLFGLVFFVLVFFFGPVFAEKVIGIKEAGTVLRYMSPAFFFVSVSSAFSAYLLGSGEYINDSLLFLGRELATSLLCFLFAEIFSKYGLKVGALLKSENYLGVFGARGCGIAVSIAGLLSFIAYLFLYEQKKVSLRRFIRMDKTTHEEDSSSFVRILVFSYGIIYGLYILIFLLFQVDECFLIRKSGDNAVNDLGLYYTYVMPVIGTLAAGVYSIFNGFVYDCRYLIKDDERSSINDLFHKKIRAYLIKALPVFVFFFAFAKPVLGLLGADDAAYLEGSLRSGVFAAFFLGFAYIFGQYLLAENKKTLLFIITAVNFVLHFLFLMMFTGEGSNNLSGITMALFFSALIYCISTLVFVIMSIGIRRGLNDFLKPIIACIVTGGLSILTSTLLYEHISNIIILLIGIIMSLVFFIVVMSALRGFSKRELARIPLGGKLITFFYNSGR